MHTNCEECSAAIESDAPRLACEGSCGRAVCPRCTPLGVAAWWCDECDPDHQPAPEQATGPPPELLELITNPVVSLGQILRHRACVQGQIGKVTSELERRAQQHDLSKLRRDELSGYLALNQALAGMEYGTPEYAETVNRFRPVVDLHQQRNSHHPEHHDTIAFMGLFDLVEMVCDWAGAGEGYDGAPDLAKSLRREISRRRPFTAEQRWVILELVEFLQPGALTPSLCRQFQFLGGGPEEEEDARDAAEALREHEESGGKTYSTEELRAELDAGMISPEAARGGT